MDLSRFALVIFDKDGTLIDFDAMWAAWVEALAGRLNNVTGMALAGPLYTAMDYDVSAGRAIAGGPLAVTPMAGMRTLITDMLLESGLQPVAAESALAAAWLAPDPVSSARPLADLPRLFGALRERGLKIAIATSDDREPTIATLAGLAAAELVDFVIGADGGVPIKPAPDMVWAACRACGVAPGQAVVVGDAVPDLQMARAAGAGLAIGVTSGVSPAGLLAPFADLLLQNVQELIEDTHP